MNKDLIIDVTSTETVVALLEDKQLRGLNKEKSNTRFSVGDIYLGKVKKLMPGLNAAFVNVGYEKDAFLHYLDLGPQLNSFAKLLKIALSKKFDLPGFSKFRQEQDISKSGKITDVITSGQIIMVQVAKEPISTKGPRLTAEISIAGRNLVLIPFSDKVSVSQKITSDEERKRLKNLLQNIKPANYGVIIRTAAKSKRVATLDSELRNLVFKWESGLEKVVDTAAPDLLISELSRTSSIVRDSLNASFNNIFVNDKVLFNEIKEYIGTIAPEKQKIVKFYSGKNPIFEQFGVDAQIKALFGKSITIKGGAYLIIEHTEALHVIDVNSGSRNNKLKDQETSAFETNIGAATEIARQLSLRDMGGIIVVDFIDMLNSDNRKLLFEKMKELMAGDKARHNILPLSKFGLMQITRQRVRPEMLIDTVEKCPTCSGTGEISSSIIILEEIENNLKYIRRQHPEQKDLNLKVHPFVAAFITKGFLNSLRRQWNKKYNCSITIKPSKTVSFLDYFFTDKNNVDIVV